MLNCTTSLVTTHIYYAIIPTYYTVHIKLQYFHRFLAKSRNQGSVCSRVSRLEGFTYLLLLSTPLFVLNRGHCGFRLMYNYLPVFFEKSWWQGLNHRPVAKRALYHLRDFFFNATVLWCSIYWFRFL